MFQDLHRHGVVVREELKEYLKEIQMVASERVFDVPEASVVCATGHYLEEVRDVASRFSADVRDVIVVGIGGSNLGTKAIYDALAPNGLGARLHFAETLSPHVLNTLFTVIEEAEDLKQVVFVFISKSGSTSETVFYMETLSAKAKERWGDDFVQQCVAITDADSTLHQAADRLSMQVLLMHASIGGRYSVFSPVGLLPLLLAGVEVEQLLLGAQEVLESTPEVHPALISAEVVFDQYMRGIRIHNSFFFHSELESLGKWYRQLMGESLGKRYSLDGAEVRAGITPIVSIGSSDLHSMAQLYFGGPADKYTELLYCASAAGDARLDDSLFEVNTLVVRKKMSDVATAIYKGVVHAYQENALVYSEISPKALDARFLGIYMQWKMMEIMLLARMMDVNAFDQPNVEDYKVETKRLLQG